MSEHIKDTFDAICPAHGVVPKNRVVRDSFGYVADYFCPGCEKGCGYHDPTFGRCPVSEGDFCFPEGVSK